MKIEGSYPFAAPRDVLWPMLLDPTTLADVMPGCEELEAVGENQYHGTLRIKVGPVQGKFQGDVILSDIESPHSYKFNIDGKGAPGFVMGSGSLRLEEDGDMTLLHYMGDAQVGGRLASVGQRLLDTSANAIIRQSLEGLGQQVQMRMMAQASDSLEMPQVTQSGAPSQSAFAAGVAKNILDEYLAPENRDSLLKGVLGIVGVLLLIQLLSNWWANKIGQKVATTMEKEVSQA